MWAYRLMLKIPLTARVTKEEVCKQRKVMCIIKKRKLDCFDHVTRNYKYQLFHIIIPGKVEGRHGPGRRVVRVKKYAPVV